MKTGIDESANSFSGQTKKYSPRSHVVFWSVRARAERSRDAISGLAKELFVMSLYFRWFNDTIPLYKLYVFHFPQVSIRLSKRPFRGGRLLKHGCLLCKFRKVICIIIIALFHSPKHFTQVNKRNSFELVKLLNL